MDSQINCTCTILEEIQSFQSPSEFERFSEYVKGLLNDNDLKEVPVGKRYADNKMFNEHWYECNLCKQIWRLVPPDFPFRGLWQKI